MMYGDVMAMFNKTWNNWAVNAAAGISNNTTKTNMLKLDSGKAGLYYANVFSVPNMILNDGHSLYRRNPEFTSRRPVRIRHRPDRLERKSLSGLNRPQRLVVHTGKHQQQEFWLLLSVSGCILDYRPYYQTAILD